jgi:hypothetical protein
MTAPTSEAELLAKLRRTAPYCEPSFYNLDDEVALALLTSWRDEAVRAERERAYGDAIEFWRVALQEHPSHE